MFGAGSRVGGDQGVGHAYAAAGCGDAVSDHSRAMERGAARRQGSSCASWEVADTGQRAPGPAPRSKSHRTASWSLPAATTGPLSLSHPTLLRRLSCWPPSSSCSVVVSCHSEAAARRDRKQPRAPVIIDSADGECLHSLGGNVVVRGGSRGDRGREKRVEVIVVRLLLCKAFVLYVEVRVCQDVEEPCVIRRRWRCCEDGSNCRQD